MDLSIRCKSRPLGHPSASHAIVLVNISGVTVSALDPLEGPEPCLYSTAAFDLAWRLAGREALVIEATPQMP